MGLCFFLAAVFLKRPQELPKDDYAYQEEVEKPMRQHPWGSSVFFLGGFVLESPWVPRPQWQAAAGTKASRNWLAACW